MSSVPGPVEIREERERKQKLRDQKALTLRQQRTVFKDKLAKLTDNQRSFIKIRLDNPSWSDQRCVRESDYKLSMSSKASGIVKSIEGKLGNVFADCFDYDEYDLCKTIVDAARTATIKTFIVIKQYDSETGKVSSEEIITNEQPDHKTRLFAARQIARFGSYEAASRLKVEHSGILGLATFAENMTTAQIEQEEREITADYEVVDESIN